MPMQTQALLDRLKDWTDWGMPGQPCVLQTFTAGQNHTTALVQADGQKWVVKLFSHSFHPASTAQQWAAELGIAPTMEIIDQNVALMPYIESIPFYRSTPNQLSQLAHALSRLHNTENSTLPRFDLLSFCAQYLQDCDTKTRQQHSDLLPALDLFINDATDWCACHNDLVQSNCLFTTQQVWLIDWEYAMHHNPWFDLAAILLYFELDTDSARRFLAAYRDDWSALTDSPIFYAAQIALLWGDLLWHMAKYGHDYRQQNPHRFAQLNRLSISLSESLATQPE